jgi:hypothetical protein
MDALKVHTELDITPLRFRQSVTSMLTNRVLDKSELTYTLHIAVFVPNKPVAREESAGAIPIPNAVG